MYEFIVSYPLDDFPMLDGSIQQLAEFYGGKTVGCGAGFGQRDLVFWFKKMDRRTSKFIAECLTWPDVELSIAKVK